jgi:hypothetical protein
MGRVQSVGKLVVEKGEYEGKKGNGRGTRHHGEKGKRIVGYHH